MAYAYLNLDLFKVTRAALARTSIRAPARLLILELACRANAQGYCWPSVQTLSKATGMSQRSLARAALVAQEAKILNFDSGSGHETTHWQLNIDLLKELSGVANLATLSSQNDDPAQPNQSPRVAKMATKQQNQLLPKQQQPTDCCVILVQLKEKLGLKDSEFARALIVENGLSECQQLALLHAMNSSVKKIASPRGWFISMVPRAAADELDAAPAAEVPQTEQTPEQKLVEASRMRRFLLAQHIQASAERVERGLHALAEFDEPEPQLCDFND